jgi:branched-chain amino acid transport system permease protein
MGDPDHHEPGSARVIQLLVTTLSNAAVYALVAVALNVVYRSSGVLNFGAGHVAAVAGIFYANQLSGSAFGVVVTMLAGAVVALAAYAIAVRGGERLGVGHVSLSLSLLGVGLLLEFAAHHLWAKQAFTAEPLVKGTLELAGTTFATQRVVVVAIAAVFVAAVVLFVERTMVGHAMEATAADAELAELYGVRTGTVATATWLIAGAALGLAGVLQSSLAAVSTASAIPLLIFGIVAAVVGGLGSFSKAAAGALLTALLQAAFVQYVSPRYSVSMVFFLLFAVLVLRPAGLFANARTAERV